MGNSAPSAGFKVIEEEDLPPEDVSFESWNTLLDDPDKLDWLLVATRYYVDLFNNFWWDCYQLTSYKSLVYLIDFDVLRDYLEIDQAKQFDAVVLDSLFYESSKEYALPAGAFLELLDYLARMTRTTHNISATVGNMNRTEVIRQLGLFLDIEDAAELDPDATVEEILHRLDRKVLALTRLLNILTDPRFVGVVSTHDEADKVRLERIIKDVPRNPAARTKKGKRDKNDKRDATNLAIAIKRAREAKSDPQLPGYILLSGTTVVHDLPKQMIKNRLEQRFPGQLQMMLGFGRELPVISPDTSETPDISVFFPVMHPRQVVNAELLGVFENPSLTLLRTRAMRNDFHKVNDHLQVRATINRLIEAKKNDGSVMNPVLASEWQEAETSLKSIAKEMLSARWRGLYKFEQRRITSISIEHARREQEGEAVTTADELKYKSTRLLELLGQVHAAFETVPGFEYRIEFEETEPWQPYEAFKLVQLPSPDGYLPLATGEMYGDPSEDAAPSPSYYAIRWPVACKMEQFINAVRRLLVSLTREHRGGAAAAGRELSFAPVGADLSVWEEGVIVYCNDRAFGSPLQSILHRKDWGFLRLNPLLRQLKQILDDEARAGGDEAPARALIQQCRINTMFGDVVFDVEPAEGELVRYLSVISHYNLGPQIALLYKATGTQANNIILKKLSRELRETFADYEELPETVRRRSK